MRARLLIKKCRLSYIKRLFFFDEYSTTQYPRRRNKAAAILCLLAHGAAFPRDVVPDQSPSLPPDVAAMVL